MRRANAHVQITKGLIIDRDGMMRRAGADNRIYSRHAFIDEVNGKCSLYWSPRHNRLRRDRGLSARIITLQQEN